MKKLRRKDKVLVAYGFIVSEGYGATLSIGALLLLALTVALPSFFPPQQLIYKLLLGILIGFGGIIA